MLFGPLIWPLATLAIALIFRKDVGQALGRVGQFKYRDLELTFRDDLRQAEQLARSVPPLASTAKGSIVLEVAPEETKELVGRLIVSPSSAVAVPPSAEAGASVALAPREAIAAAWERVVRALARATSTEGNRRAPGLTNPDVAARFLVDRGRLAAPESLLVGLLRTMKDRAADPREATPSAEETRRYVELADGFVARLDAPG